MHYIYKITNDVNNKVYIGKTGTSIQQRFAEHIRDSRKETHEKRPLYEAIKKYGAEHFYVEEIEQLNTDEEACEREIYWIKYYNSYIGFKNSNGYNATLDGDGKTYYNYKEIAEKYKILQNQKMTAQFFNCDIETVRKACRDYNVSILSPQEVTKKQESKRVVQLDKDTEEIIKIYSGVKEAFRQLGKTPGGGISKACRENRIYLGYKWKFI